MNGEKDLGMEKHTFFAGRGHVEGRNVYAIAIKQKRVLHCHKGMQGLQLPLAQYVLNTFASI
jgi:hypothetical protein